MYPRRYSWKRMLLQYGAAIVVYVVVSQLLAGNPQGPLIAIMAMLATLIILRMVFRRGRDTTADQNIPAASRDLSTPPSDRPAPSSSPFPSGGIWGPRRFPGWKRIVLEYAAMFLVYIAVISLTNNVLLALAGMIGTMFVGRATRDPGP